MDLVYHWLQSNSGLATAISWLIGVPSIIAIVHKYSPIIRKYTKVTAKVLEFIDETLDALQDDKVTPEEIAKLVETGQELKEALK
jgi:hypothetical protein